MRRLMTISVALVLGLALLACSDDEGGDDGGGEEATEETTETTEAESGPASIDVSLTAEGIEGLPESVPAGLVETSVDSPEDLSSQMDIVRVSEDVTPEQFFEDFAPVLDGGPFPDYVEGGAGAADGSTITLDAGDYIAFFDRAANLDRPSTADDLVGTNLTVTEGDDDAELPEADGTITMADYSFDVDVAAGPSTVNVVNEGPDQFHHAILVDFGTNAADVVEDNFPAILEAEGPQDVPEGIDAEAVDFEFASSGVFGVDAGGTIEAEFESGNTYGVVCFIQDRAGGPPHAFAYDMYEVFTVD